MLPCYRLERGTTLALPTNPLVWSPHPRAVAVVTASGCGSRRFLCCGKVARGCARRCRENARTHSSQMGLTLLLLLLSLPPPPHHKAKGGTPSCWMWGQRRSGVPSRTLQGLLRSLWRNCPQDRRIPSISSGKTDRRMVTHPGLVPALDSNRLLQQGKLRSAAASRSHSQRGPESY